MQLHQIQWRMRTTLDIDSDVLDAAKALARSAHTTSGRVISDVMRRAIAIGLAHSDAPTALATPKARKSVYGFVPLTSGGKIVTNDMVRALRDETGD
jgi:hypothetical protein